LSLVDELLKEQSRLYFSTFSLEMHSVTFFPNYHSFDCLTLS
jgi:hypothetical protein